MLAYSPHRLLRAPGFCSTRQSLQMAGWLQRHITFVECEICLYCMLLNAGQNDQLGFFYEDKYRGIGLKLKKDSTKRKILTSVLRSLRDQSPFKSWTSSQRNPLSVAGCIFQDHPMASFKMNAFTPLRSRPSMPAPCSHCFARGAS